MGGSTVVERGHLGKDTNLFSLSGSVLVVVFGENCLLTSIHSPSWIRDFLGYRVAINTS